MEFLLQLALVLACLFYGARKGGMALGLLGGMGPGLVAALVATLIVDYFLLLPKSGVAGCRRPDALRVP